MSREKDISKYLHVILLLIIGAVVFLIIRPFISALLTGAILSYIFYPIYKWVHAKIRSKNIASILTCALIILLILAPLFVVLNALTKEAYVNYLISKQKIMSAEALLTECKMDNFVCKGIIYMNSFFSQPKVKYQIHTSIEKATTYVIDHISNLVLSIPKFLLNFFVVMFTIFYLFKDGKGIVKKVGKMLPLKEPQKRHLFERIGRVTFAVIYGYIIVALIQGIVGALGFFIFGISSPLIWGIAMAFFALFPFVGTPLVWAPAALIKLLGGIINQNTGEVVGGILLALYGLIFISGIDNVLRPKIISNKAKVHPIVILMGVLGGVSLFGFVGVIIGPLILAMATIFIGLFEQKSG